MDKIVVLVILAVGMMAGCKKSTNDPLWEKSYGSGKSLFIKATTDSGLVSCGETTGKPYLVKLDRRKNNVIEYKSEEEGLFSSAWFTKEIFIAAGSSGGKLLIAAIDNQGVLLWDTIITSTCKVDISSVCYLGNNELLVVGSASPDSIKTGSSGLCFVWFNTAGLISDTHEITETSFISANNAATDNSGNIYLAITRKSDGSKSKAVVAKYNSEVQKLWETELYNNPGFGALCLGIYLDNTGTLFASGETELPVASGTNYNSFTASLSTNGSVKWRKYPENTNSGTSVKTDESGDVYMLNNNCFLVSILNPADGSSLGTVRTFDVCDPENTKAYGRDFDFNYDGNLLIGGTIRGSFYLAMKSPVPQETY